jgi:hypothetical protein
MVCVISFALYGTDPKYVDGLFENLALMQRHFPEWNAYVYTAPDVTEETLTRLRCIPFVMLRPTGVLGFPNKSYRFFAIDEPDVDVMFVRDTDSRIHWRDRWAIRQFLNFPQFQAHVIRDNAMHTAPLTGGLWAIRKSAGLSIQSLYDAYPKKFLDDERWKADQNFLADVVYPLVHSSLLVHFGRGSYKSYETVVEFPFPWSEETYCGRIQGGVFVDTVDPPALRGRPLVSVLHRSVFGNKR